MRSILPIIALMAVCAKAQADYIEFDDVDRPNDDYLNSMCYPLSSTLKGENKTRINQVRVLEKSPFPCEQYFFFELTCLANGTAPADFLAEQQCLCDGNFFDAFEACYNCKLAHGVIATPDELSSTSSAMTSRSKAVCSPTPPIQGFTNLFEPYNHTSYMVRPDQTLSSDNFPNDTRVENYWTGATAAIAGKITGSAVQHLSSMTNFGNARFTPTAGAVTEGSSTTSSAPTSTGNENAATSTGGAAEVRVAGGLLAAVIGVLAAL
ncbi:hypothetical protein V496_09485 [Pseudogymnoascus sp. VKM F-4515 (FW-2607)]|nr:hypothetical protein V496_09485 [Pseudogymnoascus sp. VKM F-4515 (FW-2607)]KFY92586.1 hypothetical protein V498_04848 [Pseudogymnoascus sp. VKM F-4517 (FW-2822)]